MKNLRGEFLFGYFTLDILHFTFYILHLTFDIGWVFKGFTFAKGETFLNTARKPDSVRRLADLSAFVKKKM
jgi:hypothetical protein